MQVVVMMLQVEMPAVIPNGTVVSTTADVLDDLGNTANAAVDTTVQSSPALSLVATDSPDPVEVGEQLTYTLVATNNGPSTSTNVTLEDVLPDSVTFVSASATSGTCSQSAGIVTCELEDGTSFDGEDTVTIVGKGHLKPEKGPHGKSDKHHEQYGDDGDDEDGNSKGKGQGHSNNIGSSFSDDDGDDRGKGRGRGRGRGRN